MDDGLRTSSGQRAALLKREITSRELVEAALRRAAQTADLGAFVSLAPDVALAEADAADRLLAATPPDERVSLPPLLGLPTAHKDLVDVAGQKTTQGSRAVRHLVATDDEPVPAAIRVAGAVCIGKTQVPEFGLTAYSENDVAPPARNPHEPALTAGGSSGGTAAAIASGVFPAAIGSDAGGSIRIPSAACGLVGLKPGRGRVPADRPRVPDPLGAPDLAVSGPMATTVEDAALWFDALVGDPSLPALAAVRRPDGPRALRIGISLDSPFASWIPIRHDDAALAAVRGATAAFEAAGHRVEEARFSYDPRYPDAFTTVWTHALTRIPLDAPARERLGELAEMFLARALATPSDRLRAAISALDDFAADARRQWSAFDVVLTPALAGPPPQVGAFRALGPDGDYRLQCEWAPLTSLVNVAGAPAIVFPVAGAHPPRGVQLIGPQGSEHLLLQLAAQATR